MRPASLPMLAFSCLLLGACATAHPKSIRAMSISPSEYRGQSCDDLKAAQLTNWKRKEDLRIPLKRAAEDFPLLAGTHKHAEIESEYAEKLGRLNAIETAAYVEGCEIHTVEYLKAEYGLDGKTRPSWPPRN